MAIPSICCISYVQILLKIVTAKSRFRAKAGATVKVIQVPEIKQIFSKEAEEVPDNEGKKPSKKKSKGHKKTTHNQLISKIN